MFKKLSYKKPACAGREKGVTLVEVIISTFILLVAIIGSYLAFTKILIATSSASDRLVAAYLAQEGIEVIRNIRDTNWIKEEEDWDRILNTCLSGCQVDYKTGVPSPTPITSLPPYGGNFLNIDSSGFYTYDTEDQDDGEDTTPTKFKREITINTSVDDKLDVLVDIMWSDRGQNYNFHAEESLYNWK